jgi:hypothetical protein
MASSASARASTGRSTTKFEIRQEEKGWRLVELVDGGHVGLGMFASRGKAVGAIPTAPTAKAAAPAAAAAPAEKPKRQRRKAAPATA